MSGKIVAVTAGGPHPWIIINALIDRFGPIDVILEDGEPRSVLIKRRIKRFGHINAVGQTAMMVWTVLAKKLMRRRIDTLVAASALKPEPTIGQAITNVSSANGDDFRVAVGQLRPDVLFLVGCRLLRADMLASMPCPVLNYHAGINPKYRGMNGGYWAMVNGDIDNFGGTVHMVDAGVDTGGVLYHARGRPEPGDNFMTYAFRQAALSREICARAVEDALAGHMAPQSPDMSSQQWYHPTIWFYLWTGLTRGVW